MIPIQFSGVSYDNYNIICPNPILAPRRSSEEPCVNCEKLLRLSSEPRNLARRCCSYSTSMAPRIR